MAPFIMGGLLYYTSPQSNTVLYTDPTGNKLLAYALGSVVTGTLVIRWMVKKETEL